MNLAVFAAVFGAGLLWTGAMGQPAADQVTALPGIPGPLSSRQYSGYLRASGTIKLHYWFVESQRDPAKDPLVLWMNGGPGCSSLDGYLSELGPYLMSEDGTLSANPYAWNKVANVIFLEAPAGVGFSYSDDKNYTTSDNETAKNNYLALLDFFSKFPSMVGKPFFITGESYGGIYVPTLSVRVMANASINFQGFAIGNGLLDRNLNLETSIEYAYYHGIIGEDLWTQFRTFCCNKNNCTVSPPTSAECLSALEQTRHFIMDVGINPYDVTGDCAGGVPSKAKPASRSLYSHYFEPVSPRRGKTAASGPLRTTIPCISTAAETAYLNDPSVRKALHIPDVVPKWDVCSGIVGEHYQGQYNSMREQFLALLPKHRGLVYNGDADIMCNFLGDQHFVASLGRKELAGRRPWIYGGQVAGFVRDFSQVTFMTVKNAGHMVPSFVPGAALQMVANFLANKPQ